MANLFLPTIKYKAYVFNRIPDQHYAVGQLLTYALYDTRFNFDIEKQAEDWIDRLGEKDEEYIIFKAYYMH